MAKPQLEDGYTPIANEILEHLIRMHLPPNQWQVLFCIIRKTYGFHKKVDYIANSQIGDATGLGKVAVSRCLKELEGSHIITRKGKYIGFQKDWDQWQKLPKSATSKQSNTDTELAESATLLADKGCRNQQQRLPKSATELPKSATKVSSSEATQNIKDTTTKDTIQKKQSISQKFEVFWKAYPRRKSKGQAEKAFAKINPDEQLLATMLATIERATKSADWQKDDGKFIPYPATWLDAKGWEDEYPKEKPSPKSKFGDGWR